MKRYAWPFVGLVLFATMAVAATEDTGSNSGEKFPPDTVLVSQGSASITMGELDAAASAIPENVRGAVFDSPQRIQRQLRNMLFNEQLENAARASGLAQELTDEGRVMLAVRKFLAEQQVEAVRAAAESDIPDVEQLALERYTANPKAYFVPASADVKHVLITTESRTDAEAQELAESLHAELEADPGLFDKYVEKYSDAPAKDKNHGLIPDATSDQFVEPFREAAKKLKQPGQISPVVKTQYGYHILKLVELHEAHQPPFAELREKLIEDLRSDYVNKTVRHYVDALRNKPLDVPNPELIAAIRTRYFQDSAAGAETPATVEPASVPPASQQPSSPVSNE